YAGQEQCDDGNLVSGDGCSATCRAEPVALALGDSFTCALSSTGVVKCWGINDVGQLGIGNIDSRGGTLDTVPSKLNGIDLGPGLAAKSISARGSTVCARLENGQVKCWGKNSSGQLGTGDTDHRGDALGEMGASLNPIPLGGEAKAISTGGDHTCALLAGGSVKCWGSNTYGQLGRGNAENVSSPTGLAPVNLKAPATAISASSFVSSGWGGVVGGATCALLSNGNVQCWGYGSVVPHDPADDKDHSSGIGDTAEEMIALPALTFEGGRIAQSIVAGNASAAILNDGSLRLWGFVYQTSNPGFYGQTPDALAVLPAVEIGKKVIGIDTNSRRACAILEGGTLKCWGRGDLGALGLGSILSTQVAPKEVPSVNLGGHRALQVATGLEHTCAILDDGSMKCWGANSYGQLGLGDAKGRGDAGEKLSDDTTVSLSF